MSENRIHITAELAGIPFEVICRNKKHRNFFKDYLSQKEPLFLCEITEEDLDKEKEYLERRQENRCPEYQQGQAYGTLQQECVQATLQ